MRILHTSDWHLGRFFHNVSLCDDQEYVLDQIVYLVKKLRPDVVLVAGDVFDRAVPSPRAIQILDRVLTQLVVELGIPTIVIAGNHDGPQRLEFGSKLLLASGLYVIGSLEQGIQPIVIRDQHGPVQFIPIPYASPDLVRSFLSDNSIRGHQAAMKGLITHALAQCNPMERKVAIAHAFVTGGTESESERFLSVGGSGQVLASSFKGFDYVAMGHLHRAQNVLEGKIRYSGTPLKYSFSEREHTKSASYVQINEVGEVDVRELALHPKRDVRAIEGTLDELLKDVPEIGRDDYILAILNDKRPLLSPMAKLRSVYPNILHIERPFFGAATMGAKHKGDHRKVGTFEHFENFWQHSNQDPMTEVEKECILSVIGKAELL